MPHHPASQGLVQSLGVFIDTLLICTATGLMILLSGVLGDGGDVGPEGGEVDVRAGRGGVDHQPLRWISARMAWFRRSSPASVPGISSASRWGGNGPG